MGRLEKNACCTCHINRKASNRSYCRACWSARARAARDRSAREALQAEREALVIAHTNRVQAQLERLEQGRKEIKSAVLELACKVCGAAYTVRTTSGNPRATCSGRCYQRYRLEGRARKVV